MGKWCAVLSWELQMAMARRHTVPWSRGFNHTFWTGWWKTQETTKSITANRLYFLSVSSFWYWLIGPNSLGMSTVRRINLYHMPQKYFQCDYAKRIVLCISAVKLNPTGKIHGLQNYRIHSPSIFLPFFSLFPACSHGLNPELSSHPGAEQHRPSNNSNSFGGKVTQGDLAVRGNRTQNSTGKGWTISPELLDKKAESLWGEGARWGWSG